MPITRRILKHVFLDTASRRRKCHGNTRKHSIAAGETHLAVKEIRGDRKNYCKVCAEKILTKAKQDLMSLTF